MGLVSVHVRGPAAVSRVVQWDQPEHSQTLETERATNSTGRQEDVALSRRHDTACDVLCLSAVTIRSLLHEWLDAEGLDVRREWWVRRLLHGMRLSYKKPAKCVKDLHSPEQQHANTHRLLIKLCWLVDKHAVSAGRVVNIDETSCRLLPVHQIGWGRRGVKQAQLQGNTREATTFTVAFSMDRGPLDMPVQIRARGQDRRRLA